MSAREWSDSFLDRLRAQGDVEADAVVAALAEKSEFAAVNRLFQVMTSDDRPLPADTPPPLAEFVERTRRLPPGVDLARIERGQNVFLDHALLAGMVLLTYSLPTGYASPSLSKVLALSDDLGGRHAWRRVLGVLQMLVNISRADAFRDGGQAVVTARKMRLLHAGVRHVVRRQRPAFETAHGVPVNKEDMLFTVLTFSSFIVDGLARLGVPLERKQAEDYFYLWQVFARLMDIPDDAIPETLADAATFCAAYGRRHFVPAEQNPEGVHLARADLVMLRQRLPRAWRRLGLGVLPAVYMHELLGPEAAARVGIRPVAAERAWAFVLRTIADAWYRAWRRLDSHHHHAAISALFLQALIVVGYGKDVRFIVPDSVEAMRKGLA